MVFGTGREFPPIYGLRWKPHRRIDVPLRQHPSVGGSHHQKIVVIDERPRSRAASTSPASAGTRCEHAADEPRRIFERHAVSAVPRHDDGGRREAARGAREDRARALAAPRPASRCARASAARGQDPAGRMRSRIELQTCRSRIAHGARSTPQARRARRVEPLYLDMIAARARYIYIENQYFTAKAIARRARGAARASPRAPRSCSSRGC